MATIQGYMNLTERIQISINYYAVFVWKFQSDLNKMSFSQKEEKKFKGKKAIKKVNIHSSGIIMLIFRSDKSEQSIKKLLFGTNE